MSDEKMIIQSNGPYTVRGGVPLVSKSPVLSEQGEPIDWKKNDDLSSKEVYLLCRCGQSNEQPFCDGTHIMVGFDGTETADTSSIADRAVTLGGDNLVIKDDRSICDHSGFCCNRVTTVWKMIEAEDNREKQAEIIAMIERCPSGALSYALNVHDEAVEQDLRKEVSVIPDGPLWVTGGVDIERSDGQPFETRNRVTLCRCGASKIKPYCDGSHKKLKKSSDGD